MWSSKRKATMALKAKKGAKGISLFKPCFPENKISIMPKTAPDQKESTAAESARLIPISHPMERISLASPKPIQTPFDTSRNKANGTAIKGPDKNSKREGK